MPRNIFLRWGHSGVLAALLLPTASAFAGETSFSVAAFSTSNYSIDGMDDPVLSLQRGQTYTFSLNVSGHPFFIKIFPGAGGGNTFNNGVTNNGAQSGTLTFLVPLDAPNQLFYNCGNHGAMGNTINITDPPFAFADGFEGP